VITRLAAEERALVEAYTAGSMRLAALGAKPFEYYALRIDRSLGDRKTPCS